MRLQHGFQEHIFSRVTLPAFTSFLLLHLTVAKAWLEINLFSNSLPQLRLHLPAALRTNSSYPQVTRGLADPFPEPRRIASHCLQWQDPCNLWETKTCYFYTTANPCWLMAQVHILSADPLYTGGFIPSTGKVVSKEEKTCKRNVFGNLYCCTVVNINAHPK